MIKSFPTTFPIARTSPKCSTIVTIATGTAILIAVILNSGSEKFGIPIHAAFFTIEKSTNPKTAAAVYPATSDIRTGRVERNLFPLFSKIF